MAGDRRTEEQTLELLGAGSANGSFGELLQGALPGEGRHFLVTLPIQRFSRAVYSVRPGETAFRVRPGHKHKAATFTRLLLRHLGLPERGLLEIRSELPEGKGMASSSADLVAAARAVFAALDRPVDEEAMLSLLRRMEPTDGVMYPEFVSFFHRRVRLHRRLGLPAERLHVLAVDEGGTIDTVAYNREVAAYSARDRSRYERLLDEACFAFEASDLEALGSIATRSAELNQKRNPKESFPLLSELREATGALGVVVAHSGTCAGLLYDDSTAHARAMGRAARELLEQQLEIFTLTTLYPGAEGPDALPPPFGPEQALSSEPAPGAP